MRCDGELVPLSTDLYFVIMQMLGNQWDEEPARMLERMCWDAGTPGFEERFLARAFERNGPGIG